MAKFELKAEHIKLISNLNFKVSVNTFYGDKYIPAIDRKRPFGNSGATHNVMEILGWYCDDETGEYRQEDESKAEMLLIELPVALEIVTHQRTFTPGMYDVDMYSAYYNYKHILNYHALRKPLKEIEETVVETTDDAEQMEKLHAICMNVGGVDPWKVIDNLKWFSETGFLERAIPIFEKYKPKEKGGRHGEKQ